MMRYGTIAFLLATGLFVAAASPKAPTPVPPGESRTAPFVDADLARSDYIENCSGCHGVTGSTAPAQLPEIKDRVGWFMCTPESRAYLLRLPNVAHSRITDNAELADLMNYVVFVLGGTSAPDDATPFTAAEVARERRFALVSTSLPKARAREVARVIRRCGAPASLRALFVGPAR